MCSKTCWLSASAPAADQSRPEPAPWAAPLVNRAPSLIQRTKRLAIMDILSSVEQVGDAVWVQIQCLDFVPEACRQL